MRLTRTPLLRVLLRAEHLALPGEEIDDLGDFRCEGRAWGDDCGTVRSAVGNRSGNTLGVEVV